LKQHDTFHENVHWFCTIVFSNCLQVEGLRSCQATGKPCFDICVCQLYLLCMH